MCSTTTSPVAPTLFRSLVSFMPFSTSQVPVKAKASVPAAAAPRKAAAQDDDGTKKAQAAAAPVKKSMKEMSEAEMREEVKRMMAASSKKPTTTPAPAPLSPTLKPPAKSSSAVAGQPLSPTLKAAAPKSPSTSPQSPLASPKSPLVSSKNPSASPQSPLTSPKSPLAAPKSPLTSPKSPLASPKSPATSTAKPGAPPPLKPIDRVPSQQQPSSPQPAPVSPQPAKPTLAALTKQPAALVPAVKKVVEEKEAESEEEDYYDEDFVNPDEETATIDEEEPQPSPKSVPALSAAPVLSSPNSRIRALNASPAQSGAYMPPTPQTAQLVSVVQQHISQDELPLSARFKPIPSPKPARAAAPAAKSRSQQPPPAVVEEVRRVVLPSAKQVKAGLTRSEDAKRLKRAAWVLQRVERVEEAFELFSLQPSSQYDVWMREVGRGDKRNAGCQYSDDWRNEEVQTDVTQAEDEDTQAPEDQFVSRLTVKESVKREEGETDEAAAVANEKKRVEVKGSTIGTRLNWLHAASQLIEALLEENAQLAASSSADQASLPVSTRYPHLRAAAASLSTVALGQFAITPPAMFGKRQLRAVHLLSNQPDQLLMALSPIQPPPPATDTAQYQGLAHCSLLMLYDLSAPASPPFPTKLLYCQGSVSCVGMESERGWCVVAGLEEGSVCVWDLREADALHRRWQGSVEGVKQPVVLRHASFTSDGPFAANGGESRNHTAAVTAIRFVTQSAHSKPPANADATGQPVTSGESAPASAPSPAARSFDIFSLSSSTGNDFSFVTLDANGLLLSWSAIEARDASLAGSDTDLTMAIGSTLKLVRTHGKQHNKKPPPPATKTGEKGEGEPLAAGSAHALQLCGGDTDEYVIALSGGRLCRQKRYGGRSAPARYTLLPSAAEIEEVEASAETEGASVAGMDEVTCLTSHPLFDEYFLAGYRSGLIALYSLQSSAALQLFFPTTATSSAIVSLHWHPSSPASFIALSASNTLTVHHLLANDGNQSPATTAVQLSGVEGVEVGKGGRGGWMAGVCSSGSGAGGGRVELYALKGDDGRSTEEAAEAVREYLRRLS